MYETKTRGQFLDAACPIIAKAQNELLASRGLDCTVEPDDVQPVYINVGADEDYVTGIFRVKDRPMGRHRPKFDDYWSIKWNQCVGMRPGFEEPQWLDPELFWMILDIPKPRKRARSKGVRL